MALNPQVKDFRLQRAYMEQVHRPQPLVRVRLSTQPCIISPGYHGGGEPVPYKSFSSE